MLKKILSTALLSAFLITSCSTTPQNLNSNLTIENSISAQSTSSDWYSKLSPELKSYYSAAQGKTGEALFYSLRKIISQKNKIDKYKAAKSYMYANVDNVGGDNPGIIATYSQVLIKGTGGRGNDYVEKSDENKDGVSGDFINCEHVWPQSFFGKSRPMVSDMHHLQSTLSKPNNRRSAYPFGEVTNNIDYRTSSNSRLGLSETSETVFEPTDVSKGNIARSMMYFYTRYASSRVKKGGYSENRHWDSKVGMFIKWSTIVDQVDPREQKRNQAIFEKQGNRNPFVDVPEFANLIGEAVFKKL